MSDNRTTELRKKLNEFDVQYFERDMGSECLTAWGRKGANRITFFESGIGTPLHQTYFTAENITANQAIAATLGSERERELELLVKQLWYLVNHRSGYGYAAALEAIEELGIEVES